MTGTPTDEQDAERTAVLMSETASASSDEPIASFSRPTNLGDRYVVLEELGAGGMGTVFRAYDPVLSREVAIKVLHQRALGDGSGGQARMHREAQAMAQLNHPNVVAVYDVETTQEGGLFLAMEFVAGRSLRGWMQEVVWPGGNERRAKTVDEVLGVFIQAGRGLEEAHRVGLVHRDFKPGNVMVGDDGRVRVMDFGLARAAASAGADESLSNINASSGESGSHLSAPLTRFGTVVGTPAYMAPEQHSGKNVDARADQYAFCVALFEALAGKRPFILEGRQRSHMEQLVAQKRAGGPALPASAGAPKHVVEAIARGMAPRADDRHESMSQLLAALEDVSARNRKRLLLAGGVGLALVSVVALARSPQDEPSCDAVGAPELGTAWEDQREAVRSSVTSHGLPHAQDSFERAARAIDAFSEGWIGQRRDVCEASEIRREQSPAIRRERVACLDRQRAALERTVEVMADSDPATVTRLVDLALELPDPDSCSAERVHETTPFVPVDEAKAKEVEELRHDLDRVSVLLRASRTDDAKRELAPVLRRARELEYRPVLAETLELWARVAGDERDFATAYERYEETVEVALSCGHESVLAEATGKLVSWCVTANHAESCDAWIRVGAGVAQAGGPKSPAWLAHLGGLVVHGFNSGDWAAVVRNSEDGMRRAEAIFGPRHPRVAVFENRLAVGLNEQGKLEEARVHYERSLEILEEIYGADHPKTTPAMVNYAGLLSESGELERAEELSQRVLTIREAQYGPDDPKVANILLTMSVTARKMEKFDLAEQRLVRVVGIREGAYGDDHPSVAAALTNLSFLQMRRGEHGEAESSLLRAQAIYEALDPGHSKLAKIFGNLADLYELTEEPERAAEAEIRAYEVEEKGEAEIYSARRAFDVVERLMVLDRFADAEKYAELGEAHYLAAENPELILAHCAKAEIAAARESWPDARALMHKAREALGSVEDGDLKEEVQERLGALASSHEQLAEPAPTG